MIRLATEIGLRRAEVAHIGDKSEAVRKELDADIEIWFKPVELFTQICYRKEKNKEKFLPKNL